jgi:hypothetical protein
MFYETHRDLLHFIFGTIRIIAIPFVIAAAVFAWKSLSIQQRQRQRNVHTTNAGN